MINLGTSCISVSAQKVRDYVRPGDTEMRTKSLSSFPREKRKPAMVEEHNKGCLYTREQVHLLPFSVPHVLFGIRLHSELYFTLSIL